MTKGLRKAAAIGLAAMMSAGPAMADVSLGIYQTEKRDVDFEVFLCGPDETQMCVLALAVRGSERTKQRVGPMIGTMIVKNAKPAGKNKWRGSLTYMGHTMQGNMQLWPGEKVRLDGCAYVFFCEDLTLYAKVD